MLRPTSRPSTCTIGNVGCIDTVRERHVARLEINRTAMVTLVLTPFHVAGDTDLIDVANPRLADF